MTTFSTGGSAVTFTTSGSAVSFAVTAASNAFTTSPVTTPGAHASTHGAGGADPITTLGTVAITSASGTATTLTVGTATINAGTAAGLVHTGQSIFAAGSAAGPSLIFTGDTNTGIYSPGADQVGIATAGTARVTVDSSGRVLIGHTSNVSGYGLQSSTTDGGNASLGRFEATAGGPFIRLFKSRNASLGGNTIVNNGDSLGVFDFRGADGTGWIAAANLEAAVDGTPGTGDMPGRVTISTRAAGGSLTERMRIDNAGLITGTGTSLGAWTSYNPTLAGTGWAIGNGTVTGVYSQIGKWVAFSITVTFGSTSTFGAGSATLTVPVTMKSSDRITVNAWGVDTSLSQTYALMVTPSSTSAFFMGTIGTNGLRGGVISSNPFTWADTDVIRVTGFYEAA